MKKADITDCTPDSLSLNRRGIDMQINQKQKIRDIMFRTEMIRKRRMHPLWGEIGLIAGQPRVLSELYLNEPLTQKELADISCLDPATLSRLLDRLEEGRYITRNFNPDSRRSFLIALTDEGRTMAEKVWEAFHELEDEMLLGFSETELDELFEYMARIYRNLCGDFQKYR